MASIIEQSILIDAPVEVVWRALTEPEQVRRWFADDVDLTAEVGYRGSLGFADNGAGLAVSFQVTVVSVQPPRTFSYRWQHPSGVEAVEGNSTLVEFTLTPEGDGTRLRVVETGVEQLGWAAEQQQGFVEEHGSGWLTYLGRLSDLIARRPTGPTSDTR